VESEAEGVGLAQAVAERVPPEAQGVGRGEVLAQEVGEREGVGERRGEGEGEMLGLLVSVGAGDSLREAQGLPEGREEAVLLVLCEAQGEGEGEALGEGLGLSVVPFPGLALPVALMAGVRESEGEAEAVGQVLGEPPPGLAVERLPVADTEAEPLRVGSGEPEKDSLGVGEVVSESRALRVD
jgi:hypothetical protein